MTIAGAVLWGPDLAVVWADTELGCRPGRGMNKLAVNATARLAVTGAGNSAIGSAATLAAVEAETYDAAIGAVGHAMRSKADRMLHNRALDPREIAASPHALAGWSDALGRVVLHQVNALTLFRPVLATRWAAPDVPELAELRQDEGAAGIARVAQAQLRALREGYPAAQGGTLALAVVGPGGVMAGPLLHFATGRLLWTGGVGEPSSPQSEDASMHVDATPEHEAVAGAAEPARELEPA